MLNSSLMSRRRTIAALLVMVVACFTLMEPRDAHARGGKVNVMTRNLYLGADLTPAIAAGSIPALALAGTQIWNTVQATNFPARAKVLAVEIADADTDLIGLQEAAHWFTGASDGIPGLFPGATQATMSAIDFLAILLDELAAIGTPYHVVASQNEADIEGITASSRFLNCS